MDLKSTSSVFTYLYVKSSYFWSICKCSKSIV